MEIFLLLGFTKRSVLHHSRLCNPLIQFQAFMLQEVLWMRMRPYDIGHTILKLQSSASLLAICFT